MLFLDSSADLALSIVGWTPSLQAKRKRLTPQEAQAFEVAAHQAAPSPLNDKPEPTPEQAKANRYAVGHVDFQGIAITIECPRGSYRRGVDPDGHAWACRMPHHYGFVEATHGADGEGVDVFIGQNLDSDLVVIVNQVDPRTGAFDEHKVMLGFDSEAEARDAYLQAYEPGWKGLGSTQECTVEDFHSWLLDGDLEAPARFIQKAGFAQPEGDGTRWITVHPNGKDEPGRPVRIRPVAGKDGVFHVVGGADNKLNGLRLQDIKSPEHYRTEAKAKAKERRKKEKERLAKMTPQERQAHKESQQEAQGNVKQAEQKLIEATMRAKGVDPAQAQLHGTADGLAQHKHHQSLLSDALKTAKDAEKRLLLDAEARAAAGLGTVGGDTQLRPEDVLTTPEDEEKGPGYVRALKDRAKEAGLTSQRLAEKVHDLKERTAEIRVSEGRFTDRHEKLGDGDAVAGILKAGELLGEAQREAHQQAKALKESHGAAVKEALQASIAENDSLREILEARAALKAARKAAKENKPDTFQKAYQISTEEIADQVIQDAEEALLSNRMVDFLDEVERAHPDSETLNAQNASPEDGLHASKSAGAWDALHEIGLGILGQGFLDRDAVEVLGPDGAAALAARTLKTAYTPDEQKEILQALEEIHIEEQTTETPKAMEEAERLRSEAAKEDVKLHQDAHDLAAAAQIQKNKVDMLREARRVLGSTLGRMEARAALIMALKEAPKQILTVPLGKISNQNAVITAAALGLKDGEYSLEMDSGEALLTLHPAGMDRLIAPVDHAAIHERDVAVAIKRGELDEDGFLPRGFARRTAMTCDDPLQSPPELQRPMVQLEHGASDGDIQQAMEDYVGLRLAEGHRPADVMASMTALDFLENHFPGKGLEAQGILQKVFPLGGEARTFDDIGDHLQGITARAMERAGVSADQTLHGQRLDLDHPDFSEALHQTLASDPRLQAAFLAPGDMTKDQRKAMREYFHQEIAPRMTWGDTPVEPEGQQEQAPEEPSKRLKFGEDSVEEAPDDDGYRRLSLPKDKDQAQEIIQAEAERMAGPKPEQFAASMFGDDEETPEYGEWKQRADQHAEEIRKRARIKGDDEKAAEAQALESEVRENLKGKQGGELTEEQLAATKASAKASSVENLWASYVEKMGGLTPATQALQDHMASRFLDTFKGHYERRTGKPLRTGIVKVRHADGFLGSTGTQDERDEDRSERASQDAKMRKRAGGKFASGGIADIRDERSRQGEAAQASTAALLDTSDYTEAPNGPKAPGHTERWSLGTTAENQLRQIMPGAAKALQGQNRSFKMSPISMDGKYAPQQRAVKAITQLKKIGLFYGAGCVHGDTPLTCHESGRTLTFFDWWVLGESPVVLTQLANGNTDKRKSSPVFVKGYERMLRVTCCNGASIIVTPAHRFLAPSGWVEAGSLTPGSSICAYGLPDELQPHHKLQEITQRFRQAYESGAVILDALLPSPHRSTRHALGHHQVRSSEHAAACARLLADLLTTPAEADSSSTHGSFGSHLLSSEERAPQALSAGAHHSVGTAPGSLQSCSRDSRPCDEQPLLDAACGRGRAPSQVDALSHSHPSSHRGDQEHGSAHTRACLGFDHPSKTRSSSQGTHSVPYEECHASSCGKGSRSHPHHTTSLSGKHSSHRRGRGSEALRLTEEPSSEVGQSLPLTTILSIEDVGEQIVFDITVAGSANYISQSLVNHNSGKSGIMLGAHAELHHAGKVKKAIYAVPSAVQAQFGGEAAKFLDPKSGIYIHAKPGESFKDRLEAYRHPEVHGIVVTHQALRDDCMKVLGAHLGKKPDAVKAFVHGAGRKELAKTLKEAWAAHGVEHQALMMDEGHNALNRAGKQDSSLAKLMDAMGDNATYYAGATADPLKNDISESWDWLSKMDPDRYPAEGRAEFIRRYGKNTATTRRALKAELSRYYFAERVDPSRAKADGSGMTKLTHAVHTAEVTPDQRKQLDAVDSAMARLRTAGSLADAAPHAKVISPGSFKEGMTPEEEAEAVEKVRSAAGTMREGAYGRILNYDPKGGKVQATVQLAKASHEAGEPPIVFARNHASVEAIRQELEAQGLTVVTLTGKHNAREKADRVRAFQPTDGSEPAHVLVMTDAGATGINLQRGRHVIHHDIPMTHMIHSQRAARAWRLGQTSDVRHTTVAADHAFDHQNLRRLKFKEGLAGILKSPDGYLDDTGTTERLRAIRERAGQTRFDAA